MWGVAGAGTGLDLAYNWEQQGWVVDGRPSHAAADVQLFSGCQDDQTSADGDVCPPPAPPLHHPGTPSTPSLLSSSPPLLHALHPRPLPSFPLRRISSSVVRCGRQAGDIDACVCVWRGAEAGGAAGDRGRDDSGLHQSLQERADADLPRCPPHTTPHHTAASSRKRASKCVSSSSLPARGE